MVHKRFEIVEQTDGKFCIQYQTKNERKRERNYRALSLVDRDIGNLDSAKIRLMYFNKWLEWKSHMERGHAHMDAFYWIKEFDPFTETFDDIIKRYDLRLIDNDVDQMVYQMMVETFGPKGGWDINKSYKLYTNYMLDLFFDGHVMALRYYANCFNRKDFYEKAVAALDKITTMYGIGSHEFVNSLT